MASGRFVSVGDTAVYAVPDRGLLGRAQAGRADVEAALAAHFGRPIPFDWFSTRGRGLGPLRAIPVRPETIPKTRPTSVWRTWKTLPPG